MMKYLKEVFDQLGMVAWKDLESNFLGMNQTGLQVLNRTLDEVIGKRDEDLFDPKLAEDYRRMDREVMKSGKAKHFVEKVTAPDGSSIEISVTKTPLKNEKGKIVGVIVVAIPKG